MKMKSVPRDQQLHRLRQRYASRGKQGKGRLLDELCEQWGYARKHAIKLLRLASSLPARTNVRGVSPRYQPIHDVLTHIWQNAEQLCGKRLVSALPLWLPHYARHFATLLPSQQKLLRHVSAATVDRLLADQRAANVRGLCGTKPGSLLRTQIPIQGAVWDQRRVGFLEADSVAHCGGSLAGDFVWSLTYTDLACTWTAGRAVWNKGAAGVLEQTRDVERRLPFAVLGFDFDNGSEWLNWQLIHFLQQRRRPVLVSRSRPYHKDDNAHVEQKNWMWPRQLLGYGRLAQPHVVPLINAVYQELWEPLHNFFLPSMKLRAKWRDGSRWVRRHDVAQTAYQRLLASRQIGDQQRHRLRDWYHSLDPFALAQQLNKRLAPILRTATIADAPARRPLPPGRRAGANNNDKNRSHEDPHPCKR